MSYEIHQAVAAGALYSLFFLGVLLVFMEDVKKAWAVMCLRRRLSVRSKVHEPGTMLERHIYHTMAVAWKTPLNPRYFLSFSFWLAVMTGILSVRVLSASVALLADVTAGMLPYGLLRLRAEVMRRKGSHEGEALVSEFLRQYRIHRFNVYETMEVLVREKGASGPVSRRLLYQVLTMLRNTGSEDGIKSAVEIFSKGIGTNWGRMLAKNIRLSAERGTNVSSALEDILIQLRQARELYEERNRLNGEAARMTLFMVPALYAVTLFLAAGYMDMAPARIYVNQLLTAEGLSCFMAIWFLFVINVALMELVSHQKLDF